MRPSFSIELKSGWCGGNRKIVLPCSFIMRLTEANFEFFMFFYMSHKSIFNKFEF